MTGPEIKIQAEPKSEFHIEFRVDRDVCPDGRATFADAEAAAGSSLPEKIFAFGNVAELSVAGSVVEIRTEEAVTGWMELAKQVGATIRERIQSGEALFADSVKIEPLTGDEQLKEKVAKLIDDEINPYVRSHGGVIEVLDVRESNVYLRMSGGCQGCGQASATLKQGVEQLLRERLPEVKEVLDTTDHAAGTNPYYAQTS